MGYANKKLIKKFGIKFIKLLRRMLQTSSNLFTPFQYNDQWGGEDFQDILLHTSLNRNYDSIQDYLAIHGADAPSSWTFFRRLKRLSVEKMSLSINKILQTNFIRLLKAGKYDSGPLYLAVDAHEEPYYGKREDWNSTGPKKKSTNTFITISTLCIVHPHRPLPIAFTPIQSNAELKSAQHLLDQTKNLFTGRKVFFLGDAFYSSVHLINQLDQLGYRYLIRHRRLGKIKKLCKSKRASRLKVYQGFTVKHRMERRVTNPGKAWTYLVIGKQAQFKKHRRDPGRKLKVFCWVTNCPEIGARKLLKLYKRRFRIENAFREMRPFLIRSCSNDPRVRFALVAWALLVYSHFEYLVLTDSTIQKDQKWSFKRCWFWAKPMNQRVLIATVVELLK